MSEVQDEAQDVDSQKPVIRLHDIEKSELEKYQIILGGLVDGLSSVGIYQERLVSIIWQYTGINKPDIKEVLKRSRFVYNRNNSK